MIWYGRCGVYAVGGVFIEVLYTAFVSLITHQNLMMNGSTQLWVIPMYAIGGLGIEILVDKIQRYNILLRILMYIAFFFSVEYIAGTVLVLVLGRCPWEYEGDYHLHSIINLPHGPGWGVMGYCAERIAIFLKSHRFIQIYNPNLKSSFKVF